MSSIPTLSVDDVRRAAKLIDRDGVPKRRQSTKFHLELEGRRYPPKYVVSLAVAIATGRELPADEFYGGGQTNKLLESLGFSIVGPGDRALRHSTLQPEAIGRYRADASPVHRIARVVVQGRTSGAPKPGAEMLLETFQQSWPDDTVATFTITPGGFLIGEFPQAWQSGVGWNSRQEALAALVPAAFSVLRQVLTPSVRRAAARRTRYLTLGVDLMTNDRTDLPHAELVALVDACSGDVLVWTGKSYPTIGQQHNLVQVVDLKSHFIEVAGERVLILGCHDLNLFSPRGRANQTTGGIRWKRCEDMVHLVKQFQPTIVLQHPHSTDSPNIWRAPWARLLRENPTVNCWASGIGYFRWESQPRSSLDKVLEATRPASGVLDITVSAR